MNGYLILGVCLAGLAALTIVEARFAPGKSGRVVVARARHSRVGLDTEDSYLVIGPPRVGKGTQFLIPALLRWTGPAVVASTRDDLLRACAAAAATRGPVWLFDPAGLVTRDIPGVVRAGWNPIEGCEDPLTAILRARSLVAAGRSSEGVANADFWRGLGETVLRCLLHAAAIGDRDMGAVRQPDSGGAAGAAAAARGGTRVGG